MKDQAYRALATAADRIGANNYANGLYRKHGRRGYTITHEHQQIIDAMPKVLTGEMSPDDAMAILWQYDTFKQRIA